MTDEALIEAAAKAAAEADSLPDCPTPPWQGYVSQARAFVAMWQAVKRESLKA